MFLLYHSKGCNIYEMVLYECYVNDLHTTTCSGMLGLHTCRLGETRHVEMAAGQTWRAGLRAPPPRAMAASRPAPIGTHAALISIPLPCHM
jgi:hypothetical protein